MESLSWMASTVLAHVRPGALDLDPGGLDLVYLYPLYLYAVNLDLAAPRPAPSAVSLTASGSKASLAGSTPGAAAERVTSYRSGL